MGRSQSNRHKGGLARRLHEELQLLFLNELTDERLESVEFTTTSLSSDKRLVTVCYLPPDAGADDDENQTVLEDLLEDIKPQVAARAADVLRRVPEIRFRFDRGAGNERRVSAILDELRETGALNTPPEPSQTPRPEDARQADNDDEPGFPPEIA